MVNKKDLSEEDIKNRYITPAITKSQWDLKDMRQELSVTDDKIIFAGASSREQFGNYSIRDMHEYDNLIGCGTFEGVLKDDTYSGIFTNSRGRSMSFSAQVVKSYLLKKEMNLK